MEEHLRAEEGEFWKLRNEIWNKSCILIGALHASLRFMILIRELSNRT